jgi:hypothetical protein
MVKKNPLVKRFKLVTNVTNNLLRDNSPNNRSSSKNIISKNKCLIKINKCKKKKKKNTGEQFPMDEVFDNNIIKFL